MDHCSDDINFVKKILEGKTENFTGLVKMYEDRVYGTCLKFVRNREDALDLSQETFIRIYNNLDTYKGKSSLSTWIYRICVNTCLNFLRRKDALILTGEIGIREDPDSKDPERLAQEKELFDFLDKNLNKSGEKSRKIFLYRFFHGMPFKEIAGRLKINAGSARMDYSRTRKMLKENINEYRRGE